MNKRLSIFWKDKGNRIFTLSFLIIIPTYFLLASGIFHFFGIRFNLTRSFPVGVYLLVEGDLGRGDLVFFYPPENFSTQWGRANNKIRHRNIAKMKRVYGLEGDELEVSRDGIRINGILIEKSKIVEETKDGKPIPRVSLSKVIPNGHVWLMSEHNELSFDSRYFGPVPIENIQTKVKPLWVW